MYFLDLRLIPGRSVLVAKISHAREDLLVLGERGLGVEDVTSSEVGGFRREISALETWGFESLMTPHLMMHVLFS